MFCKNCGQEYMTDQAIVCTRCGVQKGIGNQYCPNCGQPVMQGAQYCMNCGVATQTLYGMQSGKSKVAAGLLGIFLGAFGVHNFYLGYTGKAVIQLVLTIATCGFGATISGIWGFVEGIMILTGGIRTDADGRFLSE
ncbi:MAG: NINE protein [Roseburia sp.]|jgi:TM2 domain-containing membrane protein YozV|nr:NINE protein [Roseburia sp.]